MRNPLLYVKNGMKMILFKMRYGRRLHIGWIQSFDKLHLKIEKECSAQIGSYNQNRGILYLNVGEKGRLRIGDHCFFNINSSVTCLNNIEIGDNCKFGNNLVVVDHDHNYKAKGKYTEKTPEFISSPIKIGNNVWIGANVTILRGTTIGNNCVIGAGSTIKGNYPSNTVIIPNVVNQFKNWEVQNNA